MYALLRLQGHLPLNPDGIGAMSPDLAFNTAMSFVTNTNWQAYSGEAQLSYLSQMAGLTVQNFVSAASGMAVGVAVIRGFCRTKGWRSWQFLGRHDARHALGAVALVHCSGAVSAAQRVPQTLLGAVHATGLEGADQIIPRGPAAAQIAIKQLGTNGGGFFGVNPRPIRSRTRPSPRTRQCLSILLIPVAFCFLFGRMAGDKRQGWAILPPWR